MPQKSRRYGGAEASLRQYQRQAQAKRRGVRGGPGKIVDAKFQLRQRKLRRFAVAAALLWAPNHRDAGRR
jgi:hypothetical protein